MREERERGREGRRREEVQEGGRKGGKEKNAEEKMKNDYVVSEGEEKRSKK